jgi:hypothetical protein
LILKVKASSLFNPVGSRWRGTVLPLQAIPGLEEGPLASYNQAAVSEFQKLGDHKDSMVHYPLGPQAGLGLAPAYARAGNIQKAHQSYPDLP